VAPSTPSPAYPIRSLRDHVTALEAAITVCLADPTPAAVHKLRTETRRIEAHLDLLAQLKDLPRYKGKAAKVLRQLGKLRRAAGRVRDLDVQDTLIAESSLAASPDAATLHQLRRRRRKRAARKLLKLLTRRQAKIALRHEALLKALAPADSLKLSPTELLALISAHFQNLHALIIRNPSDEHLHSIRKAAKVARYQAELAATSTTARRVAKSFQALQNAGGQWHDWLDLATITAQDLGEDHAAALAFLTQSDHHLATFRTLIEGLRT